MPFKLLVICFVFAFSIFTVSIAQQVSSEADMSFTAEEIRDRRKAAEKSARSLAMSGYNIGMVLFVGQDLPHKNVQSVAGHFHELYEQKLIAEYPGLEVDAGVYPTPYPDSELTFMRIYIGDTLFEVDPLDHGLSREANPRSLILDVASSVVDDAVAYLLEAKATQASHELYELAYVRTATEKLKQLCQREVEKRCRQEDDGEFSFIVYDNDAGQKRYYRLSLAHHNFGTITLSSIIVTTPEETQTIIDDIFQDDRKQRYKQAIERYTLSDHDTGADWLQSYLVLVIDVPEQSDLNAESQLEDKVGIAGELVEQINSKTVGQIVFGRMNDAQVRDVVDQVENTGSP